MKKLVIVATLLMTLPAWGQKVTVNKKSERVKSESTDGYSTTLDGKKEEVAAAWAKYVKSIIGKVKAGSDYQFVEGPAMGGTVYAAGILYAKSTGNAETGTVWMGIRPDEWTVNDVKTVEEAVEKLVYQFGIKFYKDKIQAQINEAQQALNIVARQQQRLVNENNSLHSKLVFNEEQKIQLEKSLETNKLDHLVLEQKIVNNKKAQDSVAATTVPIKRAIEVHQERLRKVN